MKSHNQYYLNFTATQQFSRWNSLEWGLMALKISHAITKSMTYIMNKLGVDFQQGGCLYKPTSGIKWTSEYLWTSDSAQKQASEKANQSIFGSGDVVIDQFINGTMYISWQ